MTKPNRILIFDTWASSPQIETSLEIAENHKELGDFVQLVNISSKLPFLEFFHPFSKAHRYRVELKMELIGKIAKEIGILFSTNLLVNSKNSFPEEISDINSLKNYYWNEIDIGMGIASSLISKTNDLEPPIQKHRKLLNLIYSSSIIAANSFEKWHEEIKPDLIYIRNGRTALNRPVLRICQKNGYSFKVHDRGGGLDRYSIVNNYMHDREMKTRIYNDNWKDSCLTDNEKKSIAYNYFLNRMQGADLNKVFLKDQEKGTLPKHWDPKKKNITFFTGSFTEYAAIDNVNKADTIFKDQFEAVFEISQYLKNHPEYNFYVRLHPNTKQSYFNEYAKWTNFVSKNNTFFFIDGDDPVDTYTLVKKSDKVVVYMSTIGIEAAFLGIPSIIVGNSTYHNLGSNYVPETKNNLLELLTMDLKPKDQEGALKFGFSEMTMGIKYKHFIYNEKSEIGLYHGINLKNPVNSKLQKIKMNLYRKIDSFKRYGLKYMLMQKLNLMFK